jgi:YD repeat-containing protein
LIEIQTTTGNSTDTWTYQYDALGNLAASTYHGVTTQYLVNPLGLVTVAAEYDGSGNLIADFTYGLGLTSQVSASGAAEDVVKITFAGKETFKTGGQVTITPGVTGASGGAIAGTTTFTISKNGVGITPSSGTA